MVDEWSAFRKRLLEDPEVAAEYERLGPLYTLIGDIIRLRKVRGLTQAQLAELLHTKQPSIARLESGRVSPSLESIQAIAEALDARFVCRLEPREAAQTQRRSA